MREASATQRDRIELLPDRKTTGLAKRRCTTSGILISFILAGMITIAFASRAPEETLAERVSAAETIFVGVVTNRVAAGDWVHADLLVEEPLHNATIGANVAVIWRAMVSGRQIYNAAEGSRAIAILKDKHEGRYWLRDDKFENLSRLPDVKKHISGSGRP